MSNLPAVTDNSFEADVIESNLPVLVDFWAAWCNPCKAIAPILDEINTTHHEKVKIMKLDVDTNPATPPKFGVRGIPTLILFKNGQVVGTHVGLVSKTELEKFIDSHI
jgi:thioredoxin 1